jgi:HEAT repeat protein
VLAAAGGVLAATLGGSSEPGDGVLAAADAGPSTPAAMWRAGDRRGAVAAARGALAAALASSERRERAAALDAIALVAHPALAPLLYDGLAGGPDTRVESARILAELALPEAAARIREALSAASDRTRVDLALALLACGDRDGVAILEGALRDSPGDRLRAAIALAELDGRVEAVAVVEEVFANSPEGRSRWREAARVLLGLDSDRARKALIGELSHRDRERSVPAAAILAAADVEEGRGFLERLLASDDRESRSLAALALSRAGAGAAASAIDDGLASGRAAARARALAVAARLQTVEKADVIADAADEEDITVRLTASAALVALAPRMGIR